MTTETFIIENMRLFASLMIISSITFVAWILHRAGTPQPVNVSYLDFIRTLSSIKHAHTYEAIIDCAYEIEQFEYQHGHEERFNYYLKILNEKYNEAYHNIIYDLSLSAN